MKSYLKLFLIKAVVERWDDADLDTPDEETLEAVQELVGAQPPGADPEKFAELKAQLRTVVQHRNELGEELSRARGIITELRGRLEVLESVPITQGKKQPTEAKIEAVRPAKQGKKPEGQTNYLKSQFSHADAEQRWAERTEKAVAILKDRAAWSLRNLSIEVLGRTPSGRETHKLLAKLQKRLGGRLEISGRGTSYNPKILSLIAEEPSPEPEPKTQVVRGRPRKDRLTVKPELAEKLEHVGQPIVAGEGIPEEEYLPEVRERIAVMAALRPSPEERAKVLRGGY